MTERTRRVTPPVEFDMPRGARVYDNKLIIKPGQLNAFYTDVKRAFDMKEARKRKSRATRLGDALGLVTDARLEVEDLKGEIEEWKENLEGTNFESSMKYEQLEECLDALDELVSNLEECESADGNIEFPGMF